MSFIKDITEFFNKEKTLKLPGEVDETKRKKKKIKRVIINGEKYEMLVDYSSKLSNLNKEIITKTKKTDKINKEIDGKISEVANEMDSDNENLKESLNNIEKVVTDYKNIIENATNAEIIAVDSVKLLEEGQEKIDVLSKQISKINENIEKVADDISILNKRIEKIDLIDDTIKSICTQINLISLNATIENRKNVQSEDVSDNLKKLGEQSNIAYKEIEKYIKIIKNNVKEVFETTKNSIKETNKGYKLSQDLEYTFSKINEKVRSFDTKLVEIKNPNDEESKYPTKVVESLNEITKKAKESVANVTQTLTVNSQQRKELDNIIALSHELAGVNKQIENELVEIVQKKK